MSEERLQESLWLLSRARGVGILLRVLILVSPVVSVGCTRMAAGQSVPVIDLIVVGLTLACVVAPDSHLGLLVVLLVGIEWLAMVDDPTTPWSVAGAVSLTVFHAAMAAASVAPPAARWSPAMCRRWVRRSFALMAASVGTWAAMAAINRFDVASSSVLIPASLLVLAIAGVWARDGTFDAGPRR
jgi:FtsH-binding integral membrane protein